MAASHTQNTRPTRRAACWMLFLGPFFFLVYGCCNWYTTQRTDVGAIVFGWEQHIPFVPWLILPYMSIDAFFVASVFLCRSRAELDTHAYRIISAILVSAAGFLLFPLKFTFGHPPTEGFNGMLFDLLLGFDKPYNQAPSLHISLLMILWVKYAQHLSAIRRATLHLWFALVGLSVLGVYQHHFIDIVTGFWAGVFCLYLFPDQSWDRGAFRADAHSCRIGAYYATGALGAVMGAFFLQGGGWLLLWPAASLGLLALAYWHLGATVFRKDATGRLSWPALVLLLPYLAGARCSAWLYLRKLPTFVMVDQHVAIGGLRAPAEKNWHALLDLATEFPAICPTASHYRNLPVLDLTVPPTATIREALTFLKQHGERPICVHCALGLSRSATIAAAWLVHRGLAANAREAFGKLHNIHPAIVWSKAHEEVVDAA